MFYFNFGSSALGKVGAAVANRAASKAQGGELGQLVGDMYNSLSGNNNGSQYADSNPFAQFANSESDSSGQDRLGAEPPKQSGNSNFNQGDTNFNNGQLIGMMPWTDKTIQTNPSTVPYVNTNPNPVNYEINRSGGLRAMI